MRTVTFFSYKGGVGRTLCATNFAVYLAKLGLRVAIMDFDLEAPGVDSKFPNLEFPLNHPGLIDYLLEFQRTGNEPDCVAPMALNVKIPTRTTDQGNVLHVIPAGNYLSDDYSHKLNMLSWDLIFSEERNGVAFFQLFLDRFKTELNLDVLVIDSRTGFSEIGGLCTQQLADETVILSSMAAESIKMTKHLSQLITQSEIAHRLNKRVETKVVVSRLPRPNGSLDRLKNRCVELFEVDASQLFFLFSCSDLEKEEFVAMLEMDRSESLVVSYVQLFQGLNVEVAQESIKKEIERTERGLLSAGPKEAYARVRELAALYPHTEVYRLAMRFFELTRQMDESLGFAIRLLDLNYDDHEALQQVSTFFLANDLGIRRTHTVQGIEFDRLITIAQHAYDMHLLTVEQSISLASKLENHGSYHKAYEIAKNCFDVINIDPKLQIQAIQLAARCANSTGNISQARTLVNMLPIRSLTGTLARIAIDAFLEEGNGEKALEIGLHSLDRSPSLTVARGVLQAALLVGKTDLLSDYLKKNVHVIEHLVVHGDKDLIEEIQRAGIDLSTQLRLVEANLPRRRRLASSGE